MSDTSQCGVLCLPFRTKRDSADGVTRYCPNNPLETTTLLGPPQGQACGARGSLRLRRTSVRPEDRSAKSRSVPEPEVATTKCWLDSVKDGWKARSETAMDSSRSWFRPSSPWNETVCTISFALCGSGVTMYRPSGDTKGCPVRLRFGPITASVTLSMSSWGGACRRLLLWHWTK